MEAMVDPPNMEAMRMKLQLQSKDKVEDDKKRKRDLDDQGNHGHGTKDIIAVLAKRPRLKHKIDLKELQKSSREKNELRESSG
ncbi:hypothetical protein SAY87_009574 [Trapa incisa]|uniref:Uncharacterized protein n=1 Tax=Trapa incisa TaxID=236973 RepID=A0AAN7JYZ2_9MYRT|nr:hypothetical protein SAY87_009574 [Trapa incisa]